LAFGASSGQNKPRLKSTETWKFASKPTKSKLWDSALEAACWVCSSPSKNRIPLLGIV
jgi:hypothetical protein